MWLHLYSILEKEVLYSHKNGPVADKAGDGAGTDSFSSNENTQYLDYDSS